MPLNASSFITQDPLENYSIAVMNELSGYAALQLFPELIVKKSTGKFYQFTKDYLRLEASLAAPSGTAAPEGSWSAFTSTYTTVEKAHKYRVLGRDARDMDRPIADLNRIAAKMNAQKLMNDLEDAVHTKATTSSNYPSAQVLTLSAGDTWADSASDPLDDVRAVAEAIFEACGKYPNTLTLSQKGLNYLRLHPAIRELTKYTMAGPVPVELIAALMNLDKIVASKALKNTAKEGAADATSSIWDDDAVLAYVDSNTELESMSYGRTIITNRLYTKVLDAPELGRDLGAHYLESGWEFTPEFMARVSASDGDAIAGGVIINIF